MAKKPYDPIARHQRYERNKTNELAVNARYRHANKKTISLQRKGYRALNAVTIALKKKLDVQRNPAPQRRRRKRHYESKYEIELLQNAAYRKAHPDVIKACFDRRRARKKQAPICDFTDSQWEILLESYGRICVYCGTAEDLTRDHIIPLENGGSHTMSNIVPACRSCNSRKGIGPPLPFVVPLLSLTHLPGEEETCSQLSLF